MSFCDGREPTEEVLCEFFEHLRNERNFAPAALWAWLSSINHTYEQMYRKKLRDFPQLNSQIKEYGVRQRRKDFAVVFTMEQIFNFLSLKLTTPFAILAKAAMAIGFCGGLSIGKLHNLQIEDLKESGVGLLLEVM